MSQNITANGELRLSFTGRIAGWSADHRWFVLAGVVALLAAALFLSSTPGVETTEVFGAGDSRHGQLLIEDRFEKTEPLAELILFSNPSLDVDDLAFRSVVDALVTELRDLEGVASVASFYDTGLAFMVSEDRRVLMVRLVFEPGDSDELLEFVAPVIESVSDANQAAGEDFEVELFGDTSVNKAFDDVIIEDFEKVTVAALVGGLIIMVLAFGSVVAAAIPLIMAITAIFLTIGVTVLVSQVYALQEFYLQLVLLIGLAVGIDYSLFIVSRFREERAAGHPKLEAIQAASNTTGRAVFYAGLTVMVSLTGLALTGDELFIGMGIGAVIVVLFAVVLSLTLLPAVLSLLGDRVNWLRIPGLGRPSSGGGIWGAIIGAVLARPAIFATVTAAALIAVSLPVFSLHIGTAPFTSELLPSGFEFKRGMELLEENFDLSETSPLVVVVDPGKDGDVDIPEIQAAVAMFMEAVERDDAFVPPFGTQISPSGNLMVIRVPVAGIDDEDLAEAAVRKLRNDLVPNTLEGVAGIEVFVSDEFGAASTVDSRDNVKSKAPIVFAFVLGLAFLLLLVMFRSIIIPVKAIVLNLLSVGAAYGVLVLVFQNGIGESILDFKATGVIEIFMPLFLFAVLFGLSMDYHMLLLSRVKEAYDAGYSNDESVSIGITRTAALITSAAAIMVLVFGAFLLSGFVFFKQMGLGLGVAILIDATVIRAVLLPASMKLLGDWNWYLPRWLGWLPRFA
ncbi:MAG: MMPL family transporter, partial [Chloroflexi bacterium]|nr:MMPL family transporter [Chloroflexota bacterium]